MVVQSNRMIHIRNLQKSFEGRLIFEDLCMDIPEGKIVGVYGASGIGKSTLAKILCGVLPPDAGEICLDGKLLYAPKIPYDRKRGLTIQMVYQQPYSSLDYNQKIINGFHELIRYHKFAANKAEAQHLIEELMADVGLEMEI